MTLMTDLLGIVDSASKNGKWYVVVCPTAEASEEMRKHLAGAVGPSVAFSGRTARFPNSGQVTVVPAEEDPGFTSGKPVIVAFLGWERASDDSSRKMAPWRKIAQEVVRSQM